MQKIKIYTTIYWGLLFLFLIPLNKINAQYYLSGSDPASIKWFKIETDNFRIVFPDSYRDDAQQIAKVLEITYKKVARSLNYQPKKVSVLIHSETAYSNGFVTWAPKRMELYPTEHQNMYAQDWIEQLAIHEFRHVSQIGKLDTGFTRLLKYVLGEQAVGAVLGLYVPLWFLEGDAVVAETALTNTGRGRVPRFEQGIKAQVLDKGIYSYDKAVFGSYNDFIPNHYEFGYHLVAGARVKYGASLWEKALKNTGINSLCGFPFSQGLKKECGLGKEWLYRQTFNDLKFNWQVIDSTHKITDFRLLTIPDPSFVSYKYPVVYNNKIIAELSGPGEINRFVEVDAERSVKTLFVPGSRPGEPFSVSANLLCYTELEPDLRWENRMYSNIKLYDFEKEKIYRVTDKARYFSPDISYDGKKIVAVAKTSNYKTNLQVLLTTGSILDSIQLPTEAFYAFNPKWNGQGKKVLCVLLSHKGKYLASYDIQTKKWVAFTNPTLTEISFPRWLNNDEILFTGSYSGKEELYKLLISENKILQLTSSKYGATNGFVNSSGEVIYSNYSADGYQLAELKENDAANIELKDIQVRTLGLAAKLKEQEQDSIDVSPVTDMADFEVKSYSKWNIFNFHSWAPAFVNVDSKIVKPGVSAVSQNLLGTAVTTMGFNADPQMKKEKYFVNFEYSAFYPVFKFEIKNGTDRIKFDGLYNINMDTVQLSANEDISQTQIELGTYLPLNLKKGAYYAHLRPSVNYNYFYRQGYSYFQTDVWKEGDKWFEGETEIVNVGKNTFSGLEYGLYFHRLYPQSQRDINAKWGQVFELKYQHNPGGSVDWGSIYALRSRFYWPGLFKHHSVVTNFEYQQKTPGDIRSNGGDFVSHYMFGNYFNLARGYEAVNNDKLISLSLDYEFPLLNPDFSIPGLVYVKRLTADLFYDYSGIEEKLTIKTNGNEFLKKKEFKSVGFELKAETHVVRFLFPLTIGYRYSRLIEFKANKSEFLIGMNISGFSLGK